MGSIGWLDCARVDAGAHFKRNWSVSNDALVVNASGFPATESTIGLRALLMTWDVKESGSFSHSTSSESASGVCIEAGSLRYSLRASLMSNEAWLSMAHGVQVCTRTTRGGAELKAINRRKLKGRNRPS